MILNFQFSASRQHTARPLITSVQTPEYITACYSKFEGAVAFNNCPICFDQDGINLTESVHGV